MQRLSRRSISALLRFGCAITRNSTSPLSYSNIFQEGVGEKNDKVRWHWVLTSDCCSATKISKPFNCRSRPFLGILYKSTASASDSSNPSERYEYQAEEKLDPFSLVADELSILANRLRSMVVAEVPKLASAAEYFFKIGAEGKRFRPTVLLLMATAIDAPIARRLPGTPVDNFSMELRTRQQCIAEITEMIHEQSGIIFKPRLPWIIGGWIFSQVISLINAAQVESHRLTPLQIVRSIKLMFCDFGHHWNQVGNYFGFSHTVDGDSREVIQILLGQPEPKT